MKWEIPEISFCSSTAPAEIHIWIAVVSADESESKITATPFFRFLLSAEYKGFLNPVLFALARKFKNEVFEFTRSLDNKKDTVVSITKQLFKKNLKMFFIF
jgi:hypothetical protein